MIVNRLASVRDPNRLGVLRSVGLLDTPPEVAFDRLTRLAAKTLGAPIALFSLVDADRQFVKSHLGLPEPWASRRELPLTHSFCWLVVATGETLVIADSRQHPLLADSAATRELGAIAFLGVPVATAGGHVLGAICVIDRQPRVWTDDDAEVLGDLASLAASEIGRQIASRAEERQRAAIAEGAARTALLESLGEGICALDREGNCTFINRVGATMLGYRPEELLGQRLHDLIHHSRVDGSPHPAEESPVLRSLITGEGCRVEDDVLWRRDRASFAARYSAFPIFEAGAISGAVMIFADVTTSRRASTERERLLVREQSARLEAEAARGRLAFVARVSAVVGDSLDEAAMLSGVVQLVVPYLADWCAIDLVQTGGGIRRTEVAHRDPAKARLVRELAERVAADPESPMGLRKVIQTGQPEIVSEVADRDLLGIVRDTEPLQILRAVGFRSYLRVPLAAHGRTFGVLTLVHGDSDRRFQQVDGFLAEDLARRVAAALDNARLYREGQDALRVRNEFLISVSHDLRNPLANVKGFAQLLLRTVGQMTAPEAEEMATWATKIDTTTTKMTAQIDELLDLARLQSGQPLDLERNPINAVTLVRQVADACQQTTDRHRIRVEATVASLIGFWDARRIERVLANLVSNAIKYSPNGGEVAITVEAGEAAGRPLAVLTVRDSGVGIPAADLPRIFERFYRARNVGQSTGAGVGLANVRQIVEHHGGTVEVSSQEGVGTVFTVRLPLNPPPSPTESLG